MSYLPGDLCGPYTTVFDVGAFRGDFARACLEEWSDCFVHSFEPLERPPEDLIEHMDRWGWHPQAIGNKCDVVSINRNVFVPSSSMLPMAELHERAFPYTEGSEEVEVGMTTIEEFSDFIIEPALLKIDVQGYELEVLKGAGEFLTAFQGVVLEVSWEELYRGAPSSLDLSDFLLDHGFVHKRQVDQLFHPKVPSMLLQSDELWVRP